MNHFPIFLNNTNIHCIVIGGGRIATKKVKGLVKKNIFPRIISPNVLPELLQIIENQNLEWHQREFKTNDTAGFNMVFAATSDKSVNQQICNEAIKNNALIDDVSNSQNSNFHVPAVVSRGALHFAISTSGENPFLTHLLKEHFENKLPDNVVEDLQTLTIIRKSIIARSQGNEKLKQQLLKQELEPLTKAFIQQLLS